MNFAITLMTKVTVILFCAALAAAALRRASGSMRHAVWILAIASCVLLPLASAFVPPLEWAVLSEARASIPLWLVHDVRATDVQATAASDAREQKPSIARLAGRFWPYPVVIWCLGVGLFSGRFVIGVCAIRRRANASTAPADPAWQDVITEVSNSLGLCRPVRLLLGKTHASPMTWGTLHPKILLPSTAAEWPEERRRLVLAHELAHVKRNDGLIQTFVQIVCTVYWFNPAIWYAAHRVRVERERACDDYVLSLGASATDYADHLVQIARSLRAQRRFSFATVSMAQPSQLEMRLASILDAGSRRQRLSKSGAVLAYTLTALLTICLAAIRVTAVPLPPVLAAGGKFMPAVAASTPEPEATAPQRTRIGNGNAVPNNAVIPPRILVSGPPIYTGAALRAHIEGTVTLEAAVDIEGNVSILTVVSGLGYGLDEKAKAAVLGWKFAPATRNGVPVDAITQIDVDFRIPPWFSPVPDDGPAIPVGAGMTPPIPVFRLEPEYTPEARDAKAQGTVVVAATIHKDGALTVDNVVRELDYGLTEKAIEALEQWKFKPGMKDGEPVPVSLKIEVNFHLK